jgi:hypothetical protein
VQGIELAAAIDILRSQIQEAAKHGHGTWPRFTVESIDLEFQVELRTEGGVRLGAKFYVIDADVDTSAAKTRTHTLKLTLTPRGDMPSQPGSGA